MAFFEGPHAGDDLLSQTLASLVPSALAGLTAVFGMGTGVTLPELSPAQDPQNFVNEEENQTLLLDSKMRPRRPTD